MSTATLTLQLVQSAGSTFVAATAPAMANEATPTGVPVMVMVAGAAAWARSPRSHVYSPLVPSRVQTGSAESMVQVASAGGVNLKVTPVTSTVPSLLMVTVSTTSSAVVTAMESLLVATVRAGVGVGFCRGAGRAASGWFGGETVRADGPPRKPPHQARCRAKLCRAAISPQTVKPAAPTAQRTGTQAPSTTSYAASKQEAQTQDVPAFSA